MSRASFRAWALAFVTLLLGVVCCERDAMIGADRLAITDSGRSGAGGIAATDSRAESGGSPAHVCVETSCQGHWYACGNCIDDDGDGRIDMDDPDCLGPCHNAEDTFFGAIPGQNHAQCTEDCYFDQDSGSGNDGCVWSHACDPLAVAPAYPPAGAKCPYDPTTKFGGNDCQTASATQSSSCAAVCGPLTPNGCDCFGCCEIPGAATPVWLASVDDSGNPTCDLAHVSDPTLCHPCTQVAACRNPCDPCERCVGKTELPASCQTGTGCPTPVCLRGQPCGSDCLPDCPAGQSCVTGCCVAPPR